MNPGPKVYCQRCGASHPADAPHDVNSPFYQVWFMGRFGRVPLLADAMEHCDPLTQELARVVHAAYGRDPDQPADIYWKPRHYPLRP